MVLQTLATALQPRRALSLPAWTQRLSLRARLIFYFSIVAFCVVRIATFTPQPLDGPATLRPVLNNAFAAYVRLFQDPADAYLFWRILCVVVLLIAPALALVNLLREHGIIHLPNAAASVLCSRSALFGAIGLSFFICRYPVFLDYQLNPDEGEFLSAAHKLFYDGNFFASVDCGSSGPLNIYPLMLPAILGISPDFASSRMIALLASIGAAYFFYRAIGLIAPDFLARLAMLPLAGAVAVFENANLVHYSSEQIPLLAISAALYAAVRIISDPASHRGPLLLLGFLTTVAFFSKMQAVPILLALAGLPVLYLYVKGRAARFWLPPMFLIAGALPLVLLNAALCLVRGSLEDFWIRYVVTNHRYVQVGRTLDIEIPAFVSFLLGTFEFRLLLFTLMGLVVACVLQNRRNRLQEEHLALFQTMAVTGAVIAAAIFLHTPGNMAAYLYLALVVLFTSPLYFFVSYKQRAFAGTPAQWFGLLAAGSTAGAFVSLYTPHRHFPHYLLLLLIPLCAWMAWTLIRQTQAATTIRGQGIAYDDASSGSVRLPVFPLLFVALSTTYQTFVWTAQSRTEFRNIVPTIRSPAGDFISSVTSSHGTIQVWGYTGDPYLSSGHVPATRDLNLFYFFLAPPDVAPYYWESSSKELRRNRPELFIDATGPSSWALSRREHGFRNFAGIADFIQADYVYVGDLYDQQYFLRRDLAATAKPALPRTCVPAALVCADMPAISQTVIEGAIRSVVQKLPAIEMPSHLRIEAEFTPMAQQTKDATVFSNEAVPYSMQGFRFVSIGGDRYRLVLGLGTHWAYSKSVLLPSGKRVSLSIEINDEVIYLKCNGVSFDDMKLASRVADTDGPVTLGSWIGEECRFTGSIHFFQIVDLDTRP